MAGLRTCRNLLFTGKDKLVGGAPTKSSDTLTLTITISHVSTFALVQALIPAQISVSGPPGMYMDADLQKITNLALKLFDKGQKYGQLQTSTTTCKQPFKARFCNLYYGN